MVKQLTRLDRINTKQELDLAYEELWRILMGDLAAYSYDDIRKTCRLAATIIKLYQRPFLDVGKQQTLVNRLADFFDPLAKSTTFEEMRELYLAMPVEVLRILVKHHDFKELNNLYIIRE